MSGADLDRLRRLFTERYEALRSLVARRLGGASPELAGDALHEAYIRLTDKNGLAGVRHPQSYLVNTAVHAAIDRLRGDGRLLGEAEVNAFFDVPDEAAGPEQTAQARHDLARMSRALEALPARQRDILIAARVHGVPRAELARRWGISVRLVGRELQTAHEACVRAMQDPKE
ncbi:sigma-70 family RNA polymerase sigma factor [Orrella sp. JC864]|uniref:RNA polymerase sigma factor n=1 Tax=Orrella sp. JC864 TaxID=3120298 RepID=UPI00142CCD44